jgi:hypothetical protein
MKYEHARVLAMSPAEYLRPAEVGEVANSHVLENAPEPQPDFEIMKRLISERPEDLPQTGERAAR